jgi:hypothetical protein
MRPEGLQRRDREVLADQESLSEATAQLLFQLMRTGLRLSELIPNHPLVRAS